MMDSLKPSGVEGFGEIPVDWEVNKMSFTFSFGKGLSITKEDLQDEGIPSITYGDIHSRFGFQINPEVDEVRCVDPRYLKSARNSLLQYGDFIFADTSEDIAGSGNFTHFNSQTPAFAGYHTITARAKCEVDVRFIAYLFDSEPFRNQIRNSVSGVKVFSITQTILKNAKLLLPPLPEQRTISALLDECCGQVDGITADLEQQVELLRKYKKALITETVTKGLDNAVQMKNSGVAWIGEIPRHWDVNKLRYLTAMCSGATPSKDNLSYWDGDIPWISSMEVKTDVIMDTSLHISEEAVRSCSTQLLPVGTVVMVVRSGILQHTLPVALTGVPATINQDIKAFFFKSDIRPAYFKYYVQGLNDYLLCALCKEKSTVDNIDGNLLLSCPVPVPPIWEQDEILSDLDNRCGQINDLITEKQKAIETMRQYKRSLIYEYVTGKKRVAH